MKLVGGIGAATVAGGAGVMSMTGGAAASTVSISATGPSTVSNDRGDVSKVTVDPAFNVNWSGLDDAVGKVFWLLEAKVAGGDWQPIYRATPWLSAEDIGTSGTFSRPNSNNGGLGPLVIADEQGRPDYDGWNWGSYGDADLSSFLSGTSLGSAENYVNESEPVGSGPTPQNNFPDQNAGYYGAASDTAPFDNNNDDAGNGSSETTTVQLRYTIELQRPNLSQLKYRVDYDQIEDVADEEEFSNLADSEQKSIAVEQIDGLEESDIDEGNSRLVMEGEDGYQSFDSYSDGAGIPYNVLRNNTDHVGIIVETAQFGVSAQNLGSDSGVTGDSNTAAE
ncbi:hypothetical protein [Halorubrum ruber]|uniref:Uncharacterized protein n=1 Tax=Halorubrum ruber TaxID=2982524 RepID=A0A8T8LMY7_9EURY|nr:hypothetical protein [Halorubrum ruber]QUO48427.1 hypothetical protein J7656_03460 [Halorubrum ruber]